MALTNRKLAPTIDTMFLVPSESHFYLSSRLIKEIALLGGDVTPYVPSLVASRIKKKFPVGGAR
jgi:pantetheine-phosphate adenylyltransferase